MSKTTTPVHEGDFFLFPSDSLNEIVSGKFSIIERKVEKDTYYQRIRPYLDEDSMAEWQSVKDQ